MKKTIPFIFLLVILILFGCGKKESVVSNVLSKEDIAENKTLDEIAKNGKASIRLFADSDQGNLENKYQNKEYHFSVNYPFEFFYKIQRIIQEDLKLWISFQQTGNSKNVINLKISDLSFAETLRKINILEEIQQQKEIILGQKKGLELVGAEPGRRIFIFPLEVNKTLNLDINNMNLEKEFNQMIGSLKLSE